MKQALFIVLILLLAGGAWYLITSEEVEEEPASDDQELAEESEEETEAESEEEEEGTAADQEGELMELLSQASQVGSLKYEVTIETSEMTQEGTFWQKGDKLKMAGEMEGREIAMITDQDQGHAYLYFPAEGSAMEVPLTETDEVQEGSIKQHSAELPDRELAVVGSETINGMDCLVVEYTHDGSEGTMWIWKEHGLPVKIETADTLVVTENIELTDIPDGEFELPEGVSVTEAPTF